MLTMEPTMETKEAMLTIGPTTLETIKTMLTILIMETMLTMEPTMKAIMQTMLTIKTIKTMLTILTMETMLTMEPTLTQLTRLGWILLQELFLPSRGASLRPVSRNVKPLAILRQYVQMSVVDNDSLW